MSTTNRGRRMGRARGNARRRGAMMFLMLIAMVALLIAAAISIDIAYMQLTRTQLRAATDAATRAGSIRLSLTQNEASARQAARDVAARNLVAGKSLQLSDSDIVLGHAVMGDAGVWTHRPGVTPFNTVQVLGQRTTNSPSGSVHLFLGSLLSRAEFEPVAKATAVQVNRDIVLVVDRSGSMSARDAGGGQSRWEALNGALTQFLDVLTATAQDELVGLASYSSTAKRELELTDEYPAIQLALQALRPGGTTNIGSGISAGISLLNDRRHRVGAARTIIVMTDGLHNTGQEPLVAARQAAREGIVVHAITFSTMADRVRMREVAQTTGGQYFHADDSDDLNSIYRELARSTPVLLIE